jgi:hypothetical protein
MSTVPPSLRTEIDRMQWWSVAVGIVAVLVCVIGAPFSPAQFFRAYLVSYCFYLGLPLGSLAILMLYHLTGGAWGFLIQRLLEAGLRTLPLFAVLFAPIACGLGYLYLWARPEAVAQSKDLQWKQIYLNAPFFWGRAALYFIVWIVLAYFFSAWSRLEDETGEARLPRRFRHLSGPGLILYGITITFASVDWVMSLQPAFRSTIFGPIFAAGQLIVAQSFALMVMAWLAARPPLLDLISRQTFNDLGNLLFTYLNVWAYLTFAQLMLIWIANLPEEIIWYLPRSQGGWQWVAWALFIFHFVVPFFCLLLRQVKRDPVALARVAGLLFFMQLVFMYFQIMPAFPDTTVAEHWMDFVMPLGLGGICLACFLWQLKSAPLLPAHDRSREGAVHLRLLDHEKASREEALQHE